MSLSSSAFKRLSKEVTTLQNSPPEGIRVIVDESDITNVIGWIEGPPGTPYEGGYFRIKFQFSESFPNSPPKCWFATKIFHPNVAPSTGEICVSTLKKDWKKEYGVGHILITVKCLLIHPNPESALHEEAGKLLLEAYDDYARHARLMTEVHARHRPAEFSTTPSASSYQPYPTQSSSTSASASASTSATRYAAVPSLAPLQASLSQNSSDTAMSEVGTSTTDMHKSSSSGSSSASSAVIPKKRAAPPASALQSAALTSGQEREKAHGVLGASTAGVSGGNAVKKTVGTAGAGGQAAKKRGLKRL